MKWKIFTVGISLTMIFGSLLAEGNNASEKLTATNQIKEIRIAIYSMHNTLFSDTERYFRIFDGYEWQVGDKIYRFTVTALNDRDIIKGELNITNYDVFTIGWWEATQANMFLAFPTLRHSLWRKSITDFISNGGGYFGSCSAAVIMTSGLANKPTTIYENLLNRGALHLSTVKSYLEGGYIMLAQVTGHPEKIGQVAYDWYSGWGGDNQSISVSGCSVNVSVDKNNPIFDDLLGDTRLICWVGGPALEVPQNSSNVKVISYYPSQEISANQTTQIHAWKYTGWGHGSMKGYQDSRTMGMSYLMSAFFAPFKATDWAMTDTIIQTHLAKKPFMIMETYPNQNQGRMVLCGGHPEMKAWVGGHIVEANDTPDNNLYDSLHHWVNITKVYESSYNWCIFRREAAWAGKIPDNDFPPFYGVSQVSDINPYIQPSLFTVTGNVKNENEGILSVDLFYRYSNDNISWGDWKIYGTDTNRSDGWSWRFDASNANGPGYYQFYSIRHVVYDEYTETESAPPAPDVIVKIM